MQILAHNMLSQFTSRQLSISRSEKKKSIEKLSSGYKINRSADDAAGLQISEKLRWQIRGLNQGKENISDGISLIDVADGALSEVHDVLQRVRELSVQARNDTNTEQDRQNIQKEVEECLKEIDRIAGDTTFNTMPVLQGNISRTVELQSERYIYKDMCIELPAWLSDQVDDEMRYHDGTTSGIADWSSDVDYKNLKPGANDGVMYQSVYNSITGENELDYYGPKYSNESSANWKGDWNDTLSDNAAAEMSFKGLVDSSDSAKQLYENLFELIGGHIRFPCGTCNLEHQGIIFSGSALGLEIGDNSVVASADEDVYNYKYMYKAVNLSEYSFSYDNEEYHGYFDAISSMMKAGKLDKSEDVKELANVIAKDLRNRTLEVMESSDVLSHFDRAVKGKDDYSLIVYDYRDKERIIDQTTESYVIKFGEVNVGMAEEYIKKETFKSPIHIMAGAIAQNWRQIKLPNISIERLGLDGYSVAHYAEKIIGYKDSYFKKLDVYEKEMEEYNEKMKEYEKEMEEYEEKMKEYHAQKSAWDNENYEEKITPVKVTKTVLKHGYKNGEIKHYSEDETKTVMKVTRKLKQGVNPADAPKPPTEPVKPKKPEKPVATSEEIIAKRAYDPSGIDLVDRAIDQISAARSELGAMHNMLEHTYNINAITEENSQAAESRLRDADMAEEMVDLSKHSIMEQAGQSMLAQANQTPMGILRLLE